MVIDFDSLGDKDILECLDSKNKPFHFKVTIEYEGLTPLYTVQGLKSHPNFILKGSRQIVKHLMNFYDFSKVRIIKDKKTKEILTTLYG